jgi:uncharacterized membrane protein (UPF0127 family)
LANVLPSTAGDTALPMLQIILSQPDKSQAIALQAELANTNNSRKTGLMGRKQLPANQGMVFDFKTDAIQCMWMKNTPIPLDVGFFDAKKTLVNVATMQPETLNLHCSIKPIRYALEMPAGWFQAQNLGAGAILHIPIQPGSNTPQLAE